MAIKSLSLTFASFYVVINKLYGYPTQGNPVRIKLLRGLSIQRQEGVLFIDSWRFLFLENSSIRDL